MGKPWPPPHPHARLARLALSTSVWLQGSSHAHVPRRARCSRKVAHRDTQQAQRPGPRDGVRARGGGRLGLWPPLLSGVPDRRDCILRAVSTDCTIVHSLIASLNTWGRPPLAQHGSAAWWGGQRVLSRTFCDPTSSAMSPDTGFFFLFFWGGRDV